MKNIKIIVLLLIGMSLSSCDKYLDAEVVSEISAASFWKTTDDVEAYRYGCYDRFRDLNNSTFLAEDRGDSFKVGEIGPASDAWSQALDKDHTINLTSYYNALYHFNLLLQQTPLINFGKNTNNRDKIMAEALAMRAHTYLNLLKAFGDIPLILQPYEGSSTELIGRTPKEEVMAQVLADIDEAISLFKSDAIEDKNFWSKPALYALKADALIWKAKVHGGGAIDLQLAVDAINSLEGITSLNLLDDYASVFSSSNKKNNEIIFSIRFDRDEQSGQYGSRTKSRTDQNSQAWNADLLSTTVDNTARHVYAPSDELEAIYQVNPDDTREGVSIIYPLVIVSQIDVSANEFDGSQGDQIGVRDNGDIIVVTEWEKLTPLTDKYRGTFYSDVGNFNYDDDIIIYRNADLLLLRAEANAGLGNIGPATIDLNIVRNRAGIGNYTGPADKISLEKEILDERFRELFLELKRWPDLVRAHFWGTIDIYQTVPTLRGKNTPLYFPISDSDWRENPLLKQTEGYNPF
jgi:hypothetical protein